MTETLSGPIRPIAQNIRRLRMERSLSLSALARKAAISKSTLFYLEQGRGNPAIETLWALAQALGVPIGSLFVDAALAEIAVLRHEEAPVLVGRARSDNSNGTDPTRRGGDVQFIPRHLLSSRNGGPFEIYWIEIVPNTKRIAGQHSPGVLEHVVPVMGKLKVTVDDHVTILDCGDRMTFPGDRLHAYESLEDASCFISLLDYP